MVILYYTIKLFLSKLSLCLHVTFLLSLDLYLILPLLEVENKSIREIQNNNNKLALEIFEYSTSVMRTKHHYHIINKTDDTHNNFSFTTQENHPTY